MHFHKTNDDGKQVSAKRMDIAQLVVKVADMVTALAGMTWVRDRLDGER